MDAAFWNSRYAGQELVWTAQANRFLVEEVAAMSPGRALDVAAGEGRNAVWLAERGWNVDAVDFSAAGLKKGEQLLAARAESVRGAIRWIEADVTTYAPVAATYDLVAIMYLHLPVDSMRTVMRHASAALAPGGTLLVVGHAHRNIADGYGGPQAPEILYQPEDLAAMVDRLEVVRAAEVFRTVEKDGASHTAIDALLRAQKAVVA